MTLEQNTRRILKAVEAQDLEALQAASKERESAIAIARVTRTHARVTRCRGCAASLQAGEEAKRTIHSIRQRLRKDSRRLANIDICQRIPARCMRWHTSGEASDRLPRLSLSAPRMYGSRQAYMPEKRRKTAFDSKKVSRGGIRVVADSIFESGANLRWSSPTGAKEYPCEEGSGHCASRQGESEINPRQCGGWAHPCAPWTTRRLSRCGYPRLAEPSSTVALRRA